MAVGAPRRQRLPVFAPPIQLLLLLLPVLLVTDLVFAQTSTAAPDASSTAASTGTSAALVGSSPPGATTTLPPETLAPRPFPDQTPAPPPTLSPDEQLEELFVHKSFAWSDITVYKQRLINKWWVSVFVLPAACVVMNLIANLQRGIDRSTNDNLKDFVEYLSRNIAAATIIGGSLGMMAYTRVDEEHEANLERRDVRWSLLVAWSYHTIFVFTIIYSILLTALYAALSRVLMRWSQWEAGLSRDPDETPKSSVFHDLNLMILVRRLFYLQLRLVFPNANFKSSFGVQVTRYLRAKEREMVAELASFSRWSDWLVMVVFVLLNGLRMSAISQGATAVTNQMRVEDGMTFAFAVGFLPLVVFYVIYRRLVAGLWRFLRAGIATTTKRLQKKERERSMRVGRLIVAGRVVTDAEKAQLRRDGDGSALYCDSGVVPTLPDPGTFVPFGSSRAVSALWRAAIVINALYLAVLVTGLGHMLAIKLNGGPAVMVCCLLPTAGLMLMLPWSTAAVVVVRYLGSNLDVDAALYTFADPTDERHRQADEGGDGDEAPRLRGPSPRFDEGDERDATREEDILDRIDVDKPVAADRTLEALAAGVARAKAAKAAAKAADSKSGKTKESSPSPLRAGADEDTTAGHPAVPLALSEEHSMQYQRNMHHVNERLLELKAHEAELHAAVVRASHRRRKTQTQLEEFVDCVARRPDLSARWQQAVDYARLQAYEAQRAAGADYERRLAALEARQRATVASMGAEESKQFSFHDVFQQELIAIEASLEQQMVFTGSIPSLQQVYDAIGPTADEATSQLPWRKVPQLDASNVEAARRRFLGDALDTNMEQARRLRRRALRNARRSKPLNEKELERLAHVGITAAKLREWDAELQSTSSDSENDAAARATAALGAGDDAKSLDGRAAPASEAATELERMQDIDPAFWGLTEEDIRRRHMPPEPVALPELDLGLVEWREEKRRRRREERRAQGLPSDDEEEEAERKRKKQAAVDAAKAKVAAASETSPNKADEEKAKPRPSADPFDDMSLFSDAPRSSRYDLETEASPAATPAAAGADAKRDEEGAEEKSSAPSSAPTPSTSAAAKPKPKPKPKPKGKKAPAKKSSAAPSAAPSTAAVSIATTSGGRSVARHLRPDAGDNPEDDPDL